MPSGERPGHRGQQEAAAVHAGDGGAGRRIRSSAPSSSAGIVGLVRSPRHAGPKQARDPHDPPLDAGVQVAAAAVLGVEAVQVVQQGHGKRA
jgi:hypothetical protein